MKKLLAIAILISLFFSASAQLIPSTSNIKVVKLPVPKKQEAKDVDLDKWYDPSTVKTVSRIGKGYVNIDSCLGKDCDDANAKLTIPLIYFEDKDEDGFGGSDLYFFCFEKAPEGFSANDSDCNDNDKNISPASGEVCNGVDDNCNGPIDEDLPIYTYFFASGDYAADSSNAIHSCYNYPPPGYVKEVAKPVLILSATGHPINMGLHCLSWEDGSLSANNI